MIAAKSPSLNRLQREMKAAPKNYRQAQLRALSTTRRDTKADATKIAQTIYTAGRNKISAALSTSNVDKSKLAFKLIATKKGISLVDFSHLATIGKKKVKRKLVRVRVLKQGPYKVIEDAIKKRGSITGKMRIMQYQRSGPLPIIALASSSVADMLNRPEVFKRLEKFSGEKLSNELARQAARVFK